MRKRKERGAGVALWALLAVVLGSTQSDPAWADDVGVAGQRLAIGTYHQRSLAVLRSVQRGADVHYGSSASGADISGSLRVYYVDTPANGTILPIPAPWSVVRSDSIRYGKSRAPAVGPVRSALITAAGVARVTAKSLGGLDVSLPPGAGGVVVVLTLADAADGSTHRFCSRYSQADGSVITHSVTARGARLRAAGGVAIACPVTCDDGIRNGEESDVDCGGDCAACADGARCAAPCDCTGQCVDGLCEARVVNEGGPLSPVSMAETFALADTGEWAAQYARLARIDDVMPRRTLEEVVANSNNAGSRLSAVAGVDCFSNGFAYASADRTSCWRPQGLSGSSDAYPENAGVTATGRNLLAVSWHDDVCDWADGKPRGSRVTFIDVTDLDAVRYRKVLLVEPCDVDGQTTLCAVNVHAGGLVWVGRYLYLVDTVNGFRVFDVEYLLEANTADAAADDTIGIVGNTGYAFNYRYVMPQVGRYQVASRCPIRFSWASLDPSGEPGSLLSGEYVDSEAAQPDAGRVFRWALGDDGLLATNAAGGTSPTEVLYLGQRRVQGGLSRSAENGKMFWFTGSHAPGAYRLYRKTTDALEATYPWADGTPQNLMHMAASDELWSLTEFSGRPVFACQLSAVE